MRLTFVSVQQNPLIICFLLGFLFVDIVFTNPIQENRPIQEDLPKYYAHHYSGLDLPPQQINEAIKNILMQHFRLNKHTGSIGGTMGNSDESHLSETFRIKSGSSNLNDDVARDHNPDDEVDKDRNRASRNYYGWLDFRKRSYDHDDYLY